MLRMFGKCGGESGLYIECHIQSDVLLTEFFVCPQLAYAVLGEHPEKPALHLRRPRDGGGGRFAARHLSDLHGRLHQDGAQTQQSQSIFVILM